MRDTTAHDVDQDVTDAAFKLGEAAGLLSRHRKTHPERVASIYAFAMQYMPAQPASQLEQISSEHAITLIAENEGLKKALGYLLHTPNSPMAQETAKQALGHPITPLPDPRQRFKEFALGKGILLSDLEDFIGAGAPREGEYRDSRLQEWWEAYNAEAGRFDAVTRRLI